MSRSRQPLPARTLPALVLAVSVVASACTGAADAEPASTTPASSTSPVATSASTTSTIVVVEGPATATVTGDLPDGLGVAITDLYSWLLDPQNPAPRIPNGLAEHLESVPPAAAESIQATATTTELNRNGSVGVVRTDTGDVLLAADEGDGWQIVGIDPATGPPWFGDEPRMVLVLGSDARPGENQQTMRGDSIHLLTARASYGDGTILGFPRDSYLDTPFGSMKFSSLLAGRGPEVMADQIRDAWDLDVEGYLITGFVGFEDLVAELGRLAIDLPQRVNSLKYWPGFPAGEQRLTPQRTLELARTRKGVPGGDFGRSANHGLVILAALDMIQTNDIDDAPDLLDALLTHVWTDLPAGALIQLAATVFQMDSSGIENVVLPGKLGRATGGASVVRLTPEADDMLADLGDDGLLTGP